MRAAAAARSARGDFRDEENLALEQVTAAVRQALADGQPCTIVVPTDGQERLARAIQQSLAPGTAHITYCTDTRVTRPAIQHRTPRHQPGQAPGRPTPRREPGAPER